ncbi:MAG: bifunctional glutamate N-acetyltransferase/amino-acid acetyltransferase ArgJ [Actinobacteria bacterium]|nr:bifunctional glutamate N-acetyltransferase/amino-acid acetyltransferase ArgJ [Actinomycetota bacterium]
MKKEKDDNNYKILKDGTITSVPGFFAGSTNCGLKGSRKRDICIIHTSEASVCSGVFTTNKFQAAPVILDRQKLQNNCGVMAIVVNSGIANACTGKTGMENAIKTAKIASNIMGIDEEKILISSTGVIGAQLPMDKIESGIKKSYAALDPAGGSSAAEAILTTDLIKKEIAIKIDLDEGKEIIIGGIAKGSGMIEPNMATMLAFIGTDAKISKSLLDKALKNANQVSFNSISVDGCQSTNDMVIVMANGSSGIDMDTEKEENYEKFVGGLIFLMKYLAKKIVMDGEGATKFIEIKVSGANDEIQAKTSALKIANSNLFKTAIFGQDLNWGRINAALGASGCEMDPDKIDIYLSEEKIVENGIGINIEKNIAKKLLSKKEIRIAIDLKYGKGTWTVWTSDLSFDYIKINALYHN